MASYAFLGAAVIAALDGCAGARDKCVVADLRVSLGGVARDALCAAFDSAHRSIEAQFYSVGDANIIGGLNRAALRGVDVTVYVEGDRGRYKHVGEHVPIAAHVRKTAALYAKLFDSRVHVVTEGDDKVLEHAKAAVVDDTRAFVATANPNADGFAQPGQVLVEDDAPDDVVAVRDAIEGRESASSRVVAGPNPHARERITALLDATCDERIAMEDLSDHQVVGALIKRRERGFHDEVLAKCEGRASAALLRLQADRVDVRTLPDTHLHEKYVDAGDRIYIGSANLTRNGLDEAREIGLVASAADFGDGADALRANFDRMWRSAQPVAA